MSDAPPRLQTPSLVSPPLWVDTPRARIAYQVFGPEKGEPLVLIHGWPLNRRTWRNLLPFLTRFRVYAIDVPGAGETKWTEATDFSWPGQAASLKAFIDGLPEPISRYYLLGQDSGAAIARMLAMIDRPRIIKFAMTNTEIPNHRAALSSDAPGVLGAAASGRLPVAQLPEQRVLAEKPGGFGGSFNGKALIPGDFRTHVIRPLVSDPRRIEGHRRFLRGWDWNLLDRMQDLHRQITMPVLLAQDALDRTFPLDRAQAMLPQFPNAQLAAIPDATLFVHEEQPRRLAEALLAFF